MDRRVPTQPQIVPDLDEARKAGLPRELEGALLDARRSALEMVKEAVKEAKAAPKLRLNERAFQRVEGAPGTRRRDKRTKPSQSRSRGHSTWMSKAKEAHKAKRQETA
jgi:hypothetical protein